MALLSRKRSHYLVPLSAAPLMDAKHEWTGDGSRIAMMSGDDTIGLDGTQASERRIDAVKLERWR
jgi:hypothetical protein